MYLEMLIGAFGGIFLHILIKIYNINKRSPLETYSSVFNTYFKKDVGSILISVTFVALAIFASSEWLGATVLGYKVANIIKTLSVFAGYSANSLAVSLFGKTEQFIKQKFDSIISLVNKKDNTIL